MDGLGICKTGIIKRCYMGKELYGELNKILGISLNNIRLVIGKYEIYPNTILERMGKQEIWNIKLKARILGGMNHHGT